MLTIISILVSYFGLWLVSTYFIKKMGFGPEDAVMCGLFWPVMLPVTLVMWMVYCN